MNEIYYKLCKKIAVNDALSKEYKEERFTTLYLAGYLTTEQYNELIKMLG